MPHTTTNQESFVNGAGAEELLTSTPFELEDRDNTAIATPTKGSKKIKLLPLCKTFTYIALVVVVAVIAFTAGWAASWVTNDSINNTMHEGSWTKSPIDDVKSKKFDSVMEIGNAELQVIHSFTPEDNPEWGGLLGRSADALQSVNVTANDEELGDRTVLKDPVTLKPAFYIDREYVRDLAFGQIVDETGSFTDESFRFTITDAVTGDVAEIVPLSLSLKEDFEAEESDESLSAGVHPTFYFEWNKDKRAILQSNAEEGDMDLLWPKNSGDVDRANSFLNRFMELYETFIEAQSALSFDEDDLYIEDGEELYYDDQDGTIQRRDSSNNQIKRTNVEVRGNILSAWFRPKNCWVTHCRPIQIKKWVVTKSRSKCGGWLNFGRWIIKTVSKRCYQCPRRKNKCNGYPASDPRACSGNGECKKGKCQCKTGFAGSKCDTCSCRYDKSSYPTCDRCEPKYGGDKCQGCADGYWPSPLCWIKRRCHGIYFDSPNVCSGHGQCSSGISLLGKCTCNRGWAGNKCNKCAPNFTGANCDQCVHGYAGANCDQKIRCGAFDFDSPLACSGNGQCKIVDPTSPEGVCECKPDFTGTICEKNIIKCFDVESSDPTVCSGKGTCVSQDSCSCKPGYFGQKCEKVKSCNGVPFNDSQVCGGANKGTCVGTDDNTRCECTQSWSGSNCEVPKCHNVPATSDDVCSSHGTCSAPDTCTCESGYFGNECASPRTCNGLTFDDDNVCSKHGECVGNTANGNCQCSTGWSGASCNIPLCFGSPSTETGTVCSGNGECQGPDNCVCNDGFSGSRCDVIRTCGNIPFNDASVCNGNGVCSTGGKCSCQSAFNGTLCESCTLPRVNIASKCTTCLPQFDNADFPDCKQCHVGFGPEGDCTQCISGYFPVDSECKECACDADGAESSECNANGECTCKDGYTGSKCTACESDFYENAEGKCVDCSCNTEGTIHGDTSCGSDGQCTCAVKFSGKQCQIKRQCFGKTFDASDVCSGHGTCAGEDQCSCNAGWGGPQCDVPVCYDVLATNPNVCSAHGECSAPNTCTCAAGFSGSQCSKKLRCNTVDFDSSNVCSGHGTCSGEGDSGVCTCASGFKGPNCDQCEKDQYFEAPNCDTCKPAYTGDDCQSCADGYFSHSAGSCETCGCSAEGSTVLSCSASGVCTCKVGYKSTKCSESCGCNTEGTENGSNNCVQSSGQCACKDGWNGLICDTPRKCNGVLFNDAQVCGGHGTCVAEDTCQCDEGFDGPECAPSAPSCFGIRADDPATCSGNGQCVSADQCKCNSFSAGKDCGVDMKFSTGEREHYFPQTTGRYHIIDGPELPQGEKYVWTFEVLATGYWPGQTGFVYGVAGYPLASDTFHELGKQANEWGYRGRNGQTLVNSVATNVGGIVNQVGDQVRMEMDTVENTLNVYIKRKTETEFTLQGSRPTLASVVPGGGQVIRPAVAGICYQPCGIKFVE